MKEVILTGVRSNDEPTLGNYLGAFKPMVRLQQEKAGDYQLNMFVPDLHSFTTPVEHDGLYERTLKNLSYFAAAGLKLNDENTFVYRQSFIPAHSELTWILDCFTYMGEMSRMTQYKDKSGSEPNVSVGLFNYPVLMAADILLYGARWVPVGEDQRQHLEITRDIALRMNRKFDDIFTVPESWEKQLEFASLDDGVRIRSLSNPEKKMSKSVQDPRGTILLSDEPAEAAKKVMAATTDSLAQVRFDWVNQPGITNLLQILSLISNKDQDSVNAEWVGSAKYGDLKAAVARSVEEFLTDFQTKLDQVDTSALLAKLGDSEEQMGRRAAETLRSVQLAVGLRKKG